MTLLFEMPGGAEWIIIFAAIGLIFIPAIFYILNLQSTLQEVSRENRTMPPANVWLLLIPLFNLIWHFIVIKHMADSIRAEAMDRNVTLTEPHPAYNIGMAMCVLNILGIIPGIGTLASLACLVCWIIYWVKISNYKKLLKDNQFNTLGSAIQ